MCMLKLCVIISGVGCCVNLSDLQEVCVVMMKMMLIGFSLFGVFR